MCVSPGSILQERHPELHGQPAQKRAVQTTSNHIEIEASAIGFHIHPLGSLLITKDESR